MNRLQIIALIGVLIVFGGAFVLFKSLSGVKKAVPVIVVAAPPKILTVPVLVAAGDIPRGSPLSVAMVMWQDWPRYSVSEQMLTKQMIPNLEAELNGTVNRESFLRGEPIRRDKLVKTGGGSFMAAVLPKGMRAVSIKIDASGDSSAGGFILPNDHVDIIRIYRDEAETKLQGSEVLSRQVVLSNVRILAIGQNTQEQNGRRAVGGGNATVELDPHQAEILLIAQNMPGSRLILVLRSLLDSVGGTQTENDPSDTRATDLTIFRHGSAQHETR